MNQAGFVEVSLVKNDKLYRVHLPLGVEWTDAHAALAELNEQIAEHIKQLQEQQAAEAQGDNDGSES